MDKQIERAFAYHTLYGDRSEKCEDLRSKAKELARLIDALCPAGREKSLAMTKLEEATMWANASIARS